MRFKNWTHMWVWMNNRDWSAYRWIDAAREIKMDLNLFIDFWYFHKIGDIVRFKETYIQKVEKIVSTRRIAK